MMSIELKQGRASGTERGRDEAARLAQIKADAALPEGCSDAIPVAPARDGLLRHEPVETVLTPNGPRQRREVFPAGNPGRVPSALELVEARSRAKRAAPMFTAAQHHAAARYEALAHQVERGGYRLSSLDGNAGGGDGLSVTDAMIANLRLWQAMNERIGSDPVLRPRGITAHAGRRTIRADAVVRSLIVFRMPMVDLLERHGWSGQTRHRARVLLALVTAMEAIYGM